MTRHELRRPARKDTTTMSRSLDRRGLLLGAGTLLTSGVLAACSSEVEPPPAPSTGRPHEEPTPVQTTEQFARIVPEIHAAVVAADEARDVEELAPRVSGSAADFRKAAYAMIDKAEEWAEDLRTPGSELIVPMTSVTAEFPRTAIALVEDSVEEEGVPYFVVMQQKDAKSPYTCWGWAQQAVGIEMPMVANELVGAEQVTRETEDLLMTPAKALSLYANVLTSGNNEDPDDLLADNPFQTVTHERIATERRELNAGVERDEAATIKETYKVDEDEFAGLRTDDGGALVMATYLSTRTVKVADRATMSYAEDNKYTRLIGTREFTDEYVREYGTTVAVYIPPEGSDAQIQPVGATQSALGAHGQ